MASPVLTTQVVSISAALLGAGIDFGLNVFDIPALQSQPASRSLPTIRWLFSRGSHIVPQTGGIAFAGFTYLAYNAQPAAERSLSQLLRISSHGAQVNLYLAAAMLAISLGPWTQFAMVPTNFELMKLNKELGGFRSSESAKQNASSTECGARSARDSVNGKGEGAEFTDLSGPQSKTLRDSTAAEDRKVYDLLEKFKWLNWVRIVALGASGIVGLINALPE